MWPTSTPPGRCCANVPLVSSIILHENEPGMCARASTAAIIERLDTDWLRRLSLELLAG
jgi:hypothetical protein